MLVVYNDIFELLRDTREFSNNDKAIVQRFYDGSNTTDLVYIYKTLPKRIANGFSIIDRDTNMNAQGQGDGEGVFVLKSYRGSCQNSNNDLIEDRRRIVRYERI